MRWIRIPFYVLSSYSCWTALLVSFLEFSVPDAPDWISTAVCVTLLGVGFLFLAAGLAIPGQRPGQRKSAVAWVLLVPCALMLVSALSVAASLADAALSEVYSPWEELAQGPFAVSLAPDVGFSVLSALTALGVYCAITARRPDSDISVSGASSAR